MTETMGFEAASEAIMQLDFPSFGEALDMIIRNRIGNLVWANESAIVTGRKSVKDIFFDPNAGHYVTLLSHSEMRDLRLRNRMNQHMDMENARETVRFVRQSLARLGYDVLLTAIGVDIDIRRSRRDLGHLPHIVFVDANQRR
jgi:hypothetical protein